MIVRGQPRYCDRVVVVVSETIQPETWTLSSRWIGAGQSGRVASSEATEFSSAVDALSSPTTITANTCGVSIRYVKANLLNEIIPPCPNGV